MRGFLNGSSKQPLTTNEKLDNDLSQSPFGGKTVLLVNEFRRDELFTVKTESNYCCCLIAGCL